MKKTILLCTVAAVLGAVLAIGLYDPPETERKITAQEPGREPLPREAPGPRFQDDSEVVPQPGDAGLTPEERLNVAVYEKASRSAVNISTQSVQADFFMRERTSTGEGSGTVIDQQGHILTNFHVIDGVREVRVTLFDGKSYQTFEARMVGADPQTDVAVLKIEAPAKSLFPVTFGSSTGLRVGQRVFAIGNPFGLEQTLSTGIVSSLNRQIPGRRTRRLLKSIIQIDAAINPGSSGGPLLDSHGRMIGMNTAIASKTGESAGVGFAIPINTIARVVPQLIERGHVIRPDIGITGVVPVKQGLLIAKLSPSGPAERVGLKSLRIIRQRQRQGPVIYEKRSIDWSAADLIVAVDGKPVHTADGLLSIIESKKPGDEVVVTIIRDGKQQRLPVTLEAEE